MTGPVYGQLLRRLREHVDAVVAEVVHDVALPDEDLAEVDGLVRPVVVWTLDALSASDQLPTERLEELRAVGGRAATMGESLQRLLDRYLSTGWVLWGAATREASSADAAALPPLGTALLKAGDAAAAAIASGFGEAERALALRAAGARREFVDELLDLTPGDADAAARIRRRAADFGLDPAATYRLVVATIDRDIDDAGPDLEELAAAIAPAERPLPRRFGPQSGDGSAPMPLVASRRGRLVIVLPTDDGLPPTLEPALQGIAADGWLAVVASPVLGLSRLRDAYGTAIDALAVAIRLGRRGLVQADEVLLERALLADEPLLAAAVVHELGPIFSASRNSRALLDTLAAYIESAENLRATARRLGVAPRTVAYRLARIETLLGAPVRGARLARISTALLGARLLPEHVLESVTRESLAGSARPSGLSRFARREHAGSSWTNCWT
jgi:hypothetical protein